MRRLASAAIGRSLAAGARRAGSDGIRRPLRAASGHTRKRTPAGNLLGAARSYLFRQALRNTLLVAALVFADVRGDPVAPAQGSRRPARSVRLGCVGSRALFLPAPATALLWRLLFDHIDLANRPIWPGARCSRIRLAPVAAQFLVERMAEHASAACRHRYGSPHSGSTLLDSRYTAPAHRRAAVQRHRLGKLGVSHRVGIPPVGTWRGHAWRPGCSSVLIAGLLHYLVTHPPGRITPAASPFPRALGPYLGAAWPSPANAARRTG